MNLFTAVSDYKRLKLQYNNFAAPTILLLVEKTEIKLNEAIGISNVIVDLTCGYPSSGAEFDIVNQYINEKTNFNEKTSKLFQPGARVEIKLGYIATETVFVGMISSVEYTFDGGNPPFIHVECCDAKYLLMKTKRLELFRDTKLSQLVTDFFSIGSISEYITGKQIEQTEKITLTYHAENDYAFLVKGAEYIGYEFFILCGKLYFRKQPSSSFPIMTISPEQGISSARLALSTASLTGKIQVVGIDPLNDKKIATEVNMRGKYGEGSFAKRMLDGTEMTFFEEQVKSTAMASDYASVIAKRKGDKFGVLECEVIGLPQLVPGRYIKVAGLMGYANKTFYLTDVKHIFNESGYRTYISGRIDSL